MAEDSLPRPALRQTHTYALLEVPEEFYNLVHDKLVEAGYHHSLHTNNVIDMHGIALTKAQ